MCIRILLLTLLIRILCCDNLDASSFTAEWYEEPRAQRMIDQCDVTGILMNDSSNIDVTQTFTVPASGALSSIGFAVSAEAASVMTSVYQVTNGDVDTTPIAVSILDENYFAGIGPHTIPIWGYAEFDLPPKVAAGEQIAFRIQSSFAELWVPRNNALLSGELIEFPETDLGFRAYIIPEPATGLKANMSLLFCALFWRRAFGKRVHQRNHT